MSTASFTAPAATPLSTTRWPAAAPSRRQSMAQIRSSACTPGPPRDSFIVTAIPYLSGYYQVTGINDLGQIVGQTFVGGLPHGFVYSNGSYTPISDPLGTNGTAVTGINNQ